MAILARPTQGAINRAHPANKQVWCSWVCSPQPATAFLNNSAFFNKVTGERGSQLLNSTPSNEAFMGQTWTFTGNTNTAITFTRLPLKSFKQATIATIVNLNATGTQVLALFGAGSGANQGGFQLNTNGSTNLNFGIPGVVDTLSGIILSSGIPYLIIASTLNQGTTNFLVKRLDTGAISTATATQGNNTFTSTGQMTIAENGNGNGGNFQCAAVLMADNFLTLPEMLRWATIDPWGPWRPEQFNDELFSLGGGAPGTTPTSGRSRIIRGTDEEADFDYWSRSDVESRLRRVGLAPSPPPPPPPPDQGPMAMPRRAGSDEYDEYQRAWVGVRATHIERALTTGLDITKYLGLAVVAPQATLSISKYLGMAVTAPPLTLQVAKFLGLATISQFQSCGPIPVFPTLPQGFPVKVKPTFKTTVVTSSSGREVRGANQTLAALWDIELLFEELRDQTQNQSPNAYFTGFTQFMQLCQLWLSMYGQMGLFYFDAPWDDARTLQGIGTGDGQTVQFTAFRTWGIGSAQLTEPVGGINTIIEVRLNNVAQNPATYSAVGSRLVFTSPPAIGAVITMTFTYYYLCRFREDKQDFEEFSQDRWLVKSLKFRSVYWPYVGPN